MIEVELSKIPANFLHTLLKAILTTNLIEEFVYDHSVDLYNAICSKGITY